jgi:hypothetical protein
VHASVGVRPAPTKIGGGGCNGKSLDDCDDDDDVGNNTDIDDFDDDNCEPDDDCSVSGICVTTFADDDIVVDNGDGCLDNVNIEDDNDEEFVDTGGVDNGD